MAAKYVCPSCGSNNVSTFYEVHSIPVNSCILLSNERDALSFPRGDVVLGLCSSCGFIYNTAFDQSKVNYSAIYEDQQSFSSTFNAFAQNLAERLVEKYDLHNKSILEIGCGKGDFLALLCELGPNKGTGIDPAHIKGRVSTKLSDRLTFIADFYSKRYADYHGDLVCCRHTLEHIPNVFDFVHEIRLSIGDRLDTAVFFEIPDVARVLKDQAFWDIYHEHCSYFTLGSLARLFRRSEFEVIELRKDFDDQYLLIDAKPTIQPSNKTTREEESIEETIRDTEVFASHINDKLNYWRNLIKDYYNSGKRVIVWGSGSKCVAFLTSLGIRDEVEYIVDINPFRHGKYIPAVAKEIMSPQHLKKNQPDLVIVMNPIYIEEIKQMISSMDVKTKVISV